MKEWGIVLIPAGIIMALLGGVIIYAYHHPKVVDGKKVVTEVVSDNSSDEDIPASDAWQEEVGEVW